MRQRRQEQQEEQEEQEQGRRRQQHQQQQHHQHHQQQRHQHHHHHHPHHPHHHHQDAEQDAEQQAGGGRTRELTVIQTSFGPPVLPYSQSPTCRFDWKLMRPPRSLRLLWGPGAGRVSALRAAAERRSAPGSSQQPRSVRPAGRPGRERAGRRRQRGAGANAAALGRTPTARANTAAAAAAGSQRGRA